MIQRTGSGEPHDVAVGATREEAAGTFGEYFDDAFFTSYEDFDAEVDISLLRSLGLVAGDGLTAVLPGVLTRHNEPGGSPQRVLVGLPPNIDRRAVVEEVLASHPSVTFTRVLESGDSVLVPLDPVGESRPGARESLLDSLPVAPLRHATGGTRRRAEADATGSSDPEPALASHDTAHLGRWGRRRVLQTAAALGVGALLLLIVVGIVAGAEVVLLVAVLFLAASQCAMLLGLLYVVRLLSQLRRDSEDEAVFREQMRHRTARLVRLSKDSVRQRRGGIADVQKARTEIAGVRNRVMALGRLISRDGASLRNNQPPE